MLPRAPDWFFGTHYLPRNQWPSAYGIEEKLPSSVAGQLLHPFRQASPQTSLTGARRGQVGQRIRGCVKPDLSSHSFRE